MLSNTELGICNLSVPYLWKPVTCERRHQWLLATSWLDLHSSYGDKEYKITLFPLSCSQSDYGFPAVSGHSDLMATGIMCFCHIDSNITFISQPNERLLRPLLSLADLAVVQMNEPQFSVSLILILNHFQPKPPET